MQKHPWFNSAWRSEAAALTGAPAPSFHWHTGSKEFCLWLATTLYRGGQVTHLFSSSVFRAALRAWCSPGVFVGSWGLEASF